MKFKLPYEERKRVFVEAGREMQNEYQYEKTKKGEKILVKTGEFNLYEKIQEAHEETKIENVLKKVVAGDNTVLRPDGIYMDTTEIPNNLMESQRAIQSLENTWATLPNEIKKEYNYDVSQFVADAGSENWLKTMGYTKEEAKETIKEIKQTEVKEATKPEPKTEVENA